MAAGNQDLRRLPPKSRLRNPLNVVVEKVGATRAMVHGDLSVESLRELLMSSLSLLPTTKTSDDGNEEEKSGERDQKTRINNQEEEEEEEGLGPTSKHIVKDKLTAISDDKKGQESAGIMKSKIVDGVKATGKESSVELSASEKIDDETKSKKKIGERQRSLGTKTGIESESREGHNVEGHNVEGQTDEEREEDTIESLPSCLSLLSIEGSPFSNDGRWLRSHFEKPLVQGLRDVAKNKPQDPVGYLAIWLRKYRGEEEVRRRKIDFVNKLQAERLLVTIPGTVREEAVENLELENFGDSEEGGGKADSNFQNYYPGSADLTAVV